MDLNKFQNETDWDYHKRLVYGKLIDKTLADIDYSELSKYVYGHEYSSDVARRMMYGSCKTIQKLDLKHENSSTGMYMAEIDAKKIELQKERQKFQDQRNAFNKLVRDRARVEELEEILIKCIESGNLPFLEQDEPVAMSSSNDLLVSMNDIHYGANISNYWNTYNSDICSKMMRRYINRIISIKDSHQSENCIIWANGDLIHGNIHQTIAITNKENVIEQVTGVSELIAEFIAELSPHFRTVRFVSVAGNHSRISPNKDMSLVSERLDNLVEWYLKARLQNFRNVMIGSDSGYQKIDDTMYIVNVRGKNYCGIHGDFDYSPSNIQTLQTMAGVPVYAVLSGHLHHNKCDVVSGVRSIMAGSFIGMDDFCVQKRIVGKPEQLVCVCDDSGILCYYDIDLS